MSDSIAPQFKQMSELLIILNYEVSHERPCKIGLYISVLRVDLLWRILASFNKNRIKNNETTRYGGNGGMTTQLWLLLVKDRGISTEGQLGGTHSRSCFIRTLKNFRALKFYKQKCM